MLSFKQGTASDISSKISIANEQVLFSTDTQQLQFDIGSTRKAVKDPTAAKSLSISEGNLVLSDGNSSALSSISLNNFGLHTTAGAQYEAIAVG